MDTVKLLRVIQEAIWAVQSVMVSLFSWIRVWWMISKLPGPPVKIFPRLGHSHYVRDFMNHCIKWQQEFKVCHKFYMSVYPTVMIYSPEAIQEVLSKKQKHNDKGNVYHALLPLLGDGLVTTKGEKWFKNRRMITPTFHFHILESFFEVFNTNTKAYLNELNSSNLLNDFCDVIPFTRKLTLSFICETAMGSFVEAEKDEREEILRAVKMLEFIGMKRMLRPWLHLDLVYERTSMYREQEKYRKILHRFTNNVIKKRRAQIKERLQEEDFQIKKKKEIFLDHLILQQLKGENLTDDDIRDEVNTFMFAGHNTTQMAINYCLYLFGRHKDIQEKAIKEQEEIFGNSDRDPTLDDLKKMEYLGRCIKEALRLFPIIPILARRLTEDLKIGEYTLPKGADCLMMPYVTHRIPEQFPDPEKFNPDNFLPERIAERHAYSYIPFSAGPRNCIGKTFAGLAKKTVLSWFLRKFTIESKQRHEDLRISVITILIPRDGILVKITPRN